MTLPSNQGWIPSYPLACKVHPAARSVRNLTSARQHFDGGREFQRTSLRRRLGTGWPLLVAICLMFGCGPATEPSPSTILPPGDPATSSGAVTIRFEGSELDADQALVVDAVAEGTTVEVVMRSLDGPRLEMSGSGLTAFLHGVNGVSNEGDLGWTFLVDGKFATAGMGSTKLSPPTEVVWRYGAMEDSATVTEGTSSSSGRN